MKRKTQARKSKKRSTTPAKESLHLLKFAKKAAFTYGSYAVSNRAVPDIRDGLKPVHRMGLWAMHELGLHAPAKFKKSARIVGDTLGKYHPHGDSACYDALVSLALYTPNLIQGQGNWGSPVDSAAAYRYTEARLSKFASLFILNKDYLPVAEYEDNFSNEYRQPVTLPALLPNLLTMGNPTIPAYGVRAGNPSFELDGVVKLVRAGLRKGQVSFNQMLKYLKPTHWLGCSWVGDESELKDLLTSGRGSLTWQPTLKADYKARTISITTYVPGFRSPDTISKRIEKIVNMDGVSDMRNASNRKDKNSGRFGALFYVKCGRNIGEDKFFDIFEAIEKELTSTESYALGFTIRRHAKSEDATSFHYSSYLKAVNSWIKYRINLETKLIRHEISEIQKKLHRQEMLLFAAINADQLIKTVRAVKKAAPGKSVLETVALAVQKKFKLESYDDAKMLAEIPLYRISNLEVTLLRKAIREFKQEIATRKKQLKTPGLRAAEVTDILYKKFKK